MRIASTGLNAPLCFNDYMPLATVLSPLLHWPFLSLAIIFAYPAYIVIMAVVLRLIGVSKAEVIKWALRQADRQRLADLIRAVCALPTGRR